jgi:hypothetical protein
MNRRSLLGWLAAGSGALASALWLRHYAGMDADMPPPGLDLESFTPPPLNISKTGWREFLAEWDRQAGQRILARALPGGVGRTPQDNAFFLRELHNAGVVNVDAAFAPASTAAGDALRSSRAGELGMGAKALAQLETHRQLPFADCDFLARGTMGTTGADAAQIAAAEQRLRRALPSSYKKFLAASNGWIMLDTPLLPVEQVDWFINRQPEVVAMEEAAQAAHPSRRISDEQYFTYGARQSTLTVRPEYFRHLLLISARGEDNIMDLALNPQVVSEDGEWEAWKLSSHYPGAYRFRSFAKMMEWLYVTEIAALGWFLHESQSAPVSR